MGGADEEEEHERQKEKNEDIKMKKGQKTHTRKNSTPVRIPVGDIRFGIYGHSLQAALDSHIIYQLAPHNHLTLYYTFFKIIYLYIVCLYIYSVRAFENLWIRILVSQQNNTLEENIYYKLSFFHYDRTFAVK